MILIIKNIIEKEFIYCTTIIILYSIFVLFFQSDIEFYWLSNKIILNKFILLMLLLGTVSIAASNIINQAMMAVNYTKKIGISILLINILLVICIFIYGLFKNNLEDIVLIMLIFDLIIMTKVYSIFRKFLKNGLYKNEKY